MSRLAGVSIALWLSVLPAFAEQAAGPKAFLRQGTQGYYVALVLDPGQATSVPLTLPLAGMSASIISYRVLVLCRAGAELFALKHVLTPSDTDVIQIARSRAAAGGMS